ncbi:MAG: hypothetical protein V3V91_09140, partial [Thermoplasmata archaeon]
IKAELVTISYLIDSLSTTGISNLRTMISDLALNVTSHDTAIGDELTTIGLSVNNLWSDVNHRLSVINATVQDTSKLDDILADLTALDQALQQMQDDLGTIGDSGKDDAAKMDTQTMLLALLLILVIVFFVLQLLMRRRQESVEAEPEETLEEE